MTKKLSIRWIQLWIILPLVLLFLAGCELFISPMEGRTNPYDEKSPLPTVLDFDSHYENDNGNERVAFDVAINDQGDSTFFIGLTILRKAGSAPKNIYDGQVVGIWLNEDSGTVMEDNLDGVERGFTYYYSVWLFGGEKIENQLDFTGEGRILNDEEYLFKGPVSSANIVPAYRTVEADFDGVIYYDSTKSDETDTLIDYLTFQSPDRDGMDPQGTAVAINFSMDEDWDTNNLVILNCTLELFYYAPDTPGVDLFLNMVPISYEWDWDTLTWGEAYNIDFIEEQLGINYGIGGDVEQGWGLPVEMTNIMQYWIESGRMFGLALYAQDYSSVDGEAPQLEFNLFPEDVPEFSPRMYVEYFYQTY